MRGRLIAAGESGVSIRDIPTSGVLAGERGFTLLELTVSILLISLIAVTMAGALRFGIAATEKGDARMTSLERVRAATSIIEAQIQSQFPLSTKKDQEKVYYFRGDRESLDFATNYSIWRGAKGYVLAGYEVVRQDDGKTGLVAAERIIGTETVRETDVLRDFDVIAFEYYYREPAEERAEWVDEWPASDTIPGKIRLHLVYRGTDISRVFPLHSSAAAAPSLPASDSLDLIKKMLTPQ